MRKLSAFSSATIFVITIFSVSLIVLEIFSFA